MAIIGQSFTGSAAAGGRVDFGVGSLANLFSSDYTIAVLMKLPSGGNHGFFGAYSDTGLTTVLRQFYTTNNSGARMFIDNDFSSGWPTIAEDADGINDNVWRWVAQDKATGSAHAKHSYADLATLTWHHGEGTGMANHADAGSDAVLFSTWAIYAMGFDDETIAAIVLWDHQLTNLEKEAALTQSAADLVASNPASILFFKDTSNRIRNWTPGNVDDSAVERDLGFEFSSTEDLTTDGLWFYQPNGAHNTPTITATLYNSDGSSTLAQSTVQMDASGFPTNFWNFVPFLSRFTLSAGVTYVASIHVNGGLHYDPDDLTIPVTSSDGLITIPSGKARFHNSTTPPGFPDTTYSGMFGVDINYFHNAEDLSTGGVAETFRQLTAAVANPVDFDFTIPAGDTGASRRFLPFF